MLLFPKLYVILLSLFSIVTVYAGKTDLFTMANYYRDSSQYEKAIKEYEFIFNDLKNTRLNESSFILGVDEGQMDSWSATDEDSLKQEIIDAHTSYGSCLWALDNYEKGYEEFDVRLQDPTKRKLIQPLTLEVLKRDLKGVRILVIAEYGLGDTFGHLKDTKPLLDAGAEIILLAQDSLKNILLRSTVCVTRVINSQDAIPEYDYDIFLMSLRRFTSKHGLIGMKSHEDIAHFGAYIFPQQELVKKILALIGNTKPLGICWASSKDPVPGGRIVNRNILLGQLAQLSSCKNVSLFSLQGDGHAPIAYDAYKKLTVEEQLERPDDLVDEKLVGKIHTFDKNFNSISFEDTLAFMKAIELCNGYVVGCDTSITNLAGAADVPTIMLMPYNADARWGCGPRALAARDVLVKDNRFYKSVKEFWQDTSKTWEPVIERVREYIDQEK